MRFFPILVGSISLWGASVADHAVAHQMKGGDSDVHRVRVLKRVPIDGEGMTGEGGFG